PQLPTCRLSGDALFDSARRCRGLRPFSRGQKMPDLIDTKLRKLGNQLSGRLSMPGDNRYDRHTRNRGRWAQPSPLRKAELLRWLAQEGRFAPDTGCLLERLCEKLTELGAPIARATVHVRTLHPEFRGVSRIWGRGQSTEIRTSRHGIESTSDYRNSPVEHVIETGQWLDTVLSEATDRRFPILATLRAEGITHYVMAPLIFSNRIVTPVSWASDAPGGFTEADVKLFRDLVPALASVLEVTAGRRI